MKKQATLKKCIKCAYLCIPLRSGQGIQEITDTQRQTILEGIFPADYELRELLCYKRWVLPREIEKLNESACSGKQWKTHKNGIHPETLEKRQKESMMIIWWAIPAVLAVIVLGLAIYHFIISK